MGGQLRISDCLPETTVGKYSGSAAVETCLRCAQISSVGFRGYPAQERMSTINMTVPITDTISDPAQPRRFE
jgi:hypothetical protein